MLKKAVTFDDEELEPDDDESEAEEDDDEDLEDEDDDDDDDEDDDVDDEGDADEEDGEEEGDDEFEFGVEFKFELDELMFVSEQELFDDRMIFSLSCGRIMFILQIFILKQVSLAGQARGLFVCLLA